MDARGLRRPVRKLLLPALALLLLLSSSAAAESRSTVNLGTIADDYYWSLQDRLVRPKFSTKANKAWVGKLKKLQTRLKHIKQSNLDSQAKITFRMLEKELKFQRDYVEKGWIKRDINGTDSPMQSVAEYADASSLRTVNEWKWAIKTLENSEPFMSSYIKLLNSGLRDGKAQPKEAIQSAIDSLDVLTSSSASKNPFLQMETALETSMKGKKQLPALRKKLRAAVHDKVIPSHKALRSFLKKTYLPKAGKLGGDRDAYLYQMARHLGKDHASPEELHRWGKSEVKRLQRELRKTAKKINPKAKTLSSFMRGFNRRKSNQYKDANDFIDSTYAEIKQSKKLARSQVPVSRSKVKVKPVAKYQEATVAAQYYPSGKGDGVMEINTGKLLGSQRRSDLATLVTHEVFPGHHLAAMHAQKQGDTLPAYRTENANTAYDEGWALYTEQLRDEQGGFTPTQRVGYLVNHLWRASRLVVDTGLHTGTMTPTQARKYFKQNTFVTSDVAASEIQRYINWPAQALAYYVGKREILRARKQVKAILGKNYSAKKFHAKLLSLGSVPPHEMRSAVVSWAKRRKAQMKSRVSRKRIINNLRGPRRNRLRARAARDRRRAAPTRTRRVRRRAATRTKARKGRVKARGRR